MTLIRWKPFDDMERFLNQAFELSGPRSGFDLAMDVYEDGNNVIAEMAVPDVDPNHIDISVDGDLLRVTGSREDKQEKKNKNFYSREIRRGSFERTISLPKSVIADKITANYKDGLLKITMPAKETGKPHRIKVQAEK